MTRLAGLIGLTFLAAAGCGEVKTNVGDDCGDGLTDCGDGLCVNVTTDEGNCGGCGVVCDSAQACIAEACEDFSSFVIAQFDTTPAETTGWVTADGSPISFGFVPIDFEGVIYECRTGPAQMIGSVPFGPCDDGDGTTPTHTPVPDASIEEGSYQTEMRVRVDDFVSEPAVFEFYAHRSLDSVSTCPHSLSDDEIFAAAGAELLASNPPAFGASTELRNPFIEVPFVSVQPSIRAQSGPPWNSVAGGSFTVQANSLRRRFARSANDQLVLVQRRYQSRQALAVGDAGRICDNGFYFGAAEQRIDCENLVLNSRGESRCVRDVNGTAVADNPTSNGFIKLTKMFSHKGPTENCPINSRLGTCDFYLFLPQ